MKEVKRESCCFACTTDLHGAISLRAQLEVLILKILLFLYFVGSYEHITYTVTSVFVV